MAGFPVTFGSTHPWWPEKMALCLCFLVCLFLLRLWLPSTHQPVQSPPAVRVFSDCVQVALSSSASCSRQPRLACHPPSAASCPPQTQTPALARQFCPLPAELPAPCRAGQTQGSPVGLALQVVPKRDSPPLPSDLTLTPFCVCQALKSLPAISAALGRDRV